MFLLSHAGFKIIDLCQLQKLDRELIVVPIVLLVLCWQIALYFIPSILSIFLLPIVFLFITKKLIRLRKPLLRTLDKTAVEAMNHVFVVKLLGINDLIVEKLLQKMEKAFR